MKAPLTRATLVLLGVLVTLSGCAGEPKAVTDRDGVLRLDVSEYRISPQNLVVNATGAQTRIRLVVTNVGKLTHTVKVERMEPDPQPDDEGVVPTASLAVLNLDGKTQAGVGNLAPGQRDLGEPFTLEPGEYKLTDSIGNHENLGAYGTLTIKAPGG